MTWNRDDRREANRGIRWVLLWTLVIIIIFAVVGLAIWGFRVAVAPAKGQGDAAITKYSAENWTAAQGRFENEYQDVLATDQKIQLAADAAAADPDDQTKADTLTGLRSYCLSATADYNADARKYLSADFRAADLPSRIDTTDPATDCKENQ
jgi:hypothetical protein